LPSDVDTEFLQIASKLETYGFNPHLVTVSYYYGYGRDQSINQSITVLLLTESACLFYSDVGKIMILKKSKKSDFFI